MAQGSHLLKLTLRLCYNSQRTGKHGVLEELLQDTWQKVADPGLEARLFRLQSLGSSSHADPFHSDSLGEGVPWNLASRRDQEQRWGGGLSSRASPQMLMRSFPVTPYSKDISLQMLFVMTK